MTTTYQVKKWFYGLASGFIGGGAGSAASTLTACVIKPTAFNLSNEVNATICFATAMFALNGITTAFLFLRQSPLPPMETDTTFVKRFLKRQAAGDTEFGNKALPGGVANEKKPCVEGLTC